jgi:protein TonB
MSALDSRRALACATALAVALGTATASEGLPPDSTPAPASAVASRAPSAQDRLATIRDLMAQQRALLDEMKQEVGAMPVYDLRSPSLTKEQRDAEQWREHRIALIADLVRRMREARRVAYVTCPAAALSNGEMPLHAALCESVSDRILARWHAMARRGVPMHNEWLALDLHIDMHGKLLGAKLREGTGQPALDRLGLQIASSAGPFAPFSQDLKEVTDTIVATTWIRFTNYDDASAATAASGPH